MTDTALVLNAGSSSLKFAVYARDAGSAWRIDARGQVDGIGSRPRLAARDGSGTVLVDEALARSVADARAALAVLATWLRHQFPRSSVVAVGHRVVHGGAQFPGPRVVTPGDLDALRTLIPLAPLHQPHNIAAIEAVAAQLPGVPQVACFDTSFHRGQPAVAQLVPLPASVRDAGVQRYGFHGLSYEYIASVLPEVAPAIADRRIIVAHLGSGASLCALRGRKSVDSTLGFTALDGLCMGTRPGAVDPGVILHLFQAMKLDVAAVEDMLYRQSGLLGISGRSNDMRLLLESSDPGSQLAVEYFVYQAARQMGAMAAALGGVDGLVFTAGIGEHSAEVRRRICQASAWLGLALDDDANGRHGPRISSATSAIEAWVIPTDEELMIARHTAALLGLDSKAPARAHRRNP